ncbi:tetratricopeptide repeat protein [Reichenbachiella agarivorans]|uniref:Tetratricopeptide repeat protein n=1 Tax=Reichenbachiella agarivorans TaxID=2979464 RepID=A0ABY6CRG0_9BACT|nr:tetratricopeptide repeat protein [Reichenbachiella agarivorans]UXP33078.1 tetratricopeptide repeat protein [Reichenbachiella agarivorans]
MNWKITPVILGITLLLACSKKEEGYQPSTPSASTTLPTQSTFVGAETCKTCHAKEYAAWEGSHHDEAMKAADSTTVKGDFNNVSFVSNDVKYFFFKKDGKYWVNTQDGDGQYKDFMIEYTFGVTPLQQYLIPFPKGSYQTLHAAWDDQKSQWFNVQSHLKIDTTEWLHWSRGAARWNTMCADCHSTNLHKNYNPTDESYHTTFSEINVACESCHGPASEHASFYQNGKQGKAPELYMKSDMSSHELVDKCARCHSRRGQITPYFDYTGSFLDHYRPALLTSDLYELDGQIKDEVYVYNSFTQSKMYHNNVSCKDCHDVHSLKLKRQGNALCLQCHEPKYNEVSHHKHKMNTDASLCINCHMTGKTYMGNDFRRDHSFRVPRPDQTVKYGTPNACNGCHADKSAKWASDFITKEYGTNRPDHFSDLFLEGYHGDQDKLMTLIMGSKYPDIARATAVNYYGRNATTEEMRKITQFLHDSSAIVREEVINVLSNRPDVDSRDLVAGLLNDSIRLVRISAAQYMVGIDPQARNIPAYQNAMRENLTSLKLQSDFASGQHALAIYYERQGDVQAAIAAYRKAIAIDNYYNQARMNLALTLYNQGKAEEAIALYKKVTTQEPDYSYSYYMLGLLYNEQGDAVSAMKYLKLATEKQPANPRAFYNYATLLLQHQQFEEAISVAQKGELYFDAFEDLLYVKMLAQMQNGDVTSAVSTCQVLIQMSPNNQQYQQIFSQLKSKL